MITDIRMPPSNLVEGLEVARIIRLEMPDTAVVLLSAYVDIEHAMDLLAGGRGIGYLLKSRVTDVADFIETLRRVARAQRHRSRNSRRSRCRCVAASTA